jgi:hypothetical protein
VYATNVKLNGDYTNVVCAQGVGLSISYLLNEPATRGVTISVLSGTNAVRTIVVPAGGPGALLGTNSVAWDGLDYNSNGLPAGTYSVAVTAAAAGFTNWTQTSVDTNAGSYAFDPVAIAVDQNPGSRYFGRVFVSNAEPNTGGTNVGDGVGVLKLNADGSPGEESPTNWLATGGYDWAGDGFSPWKIRVSADDHVYVMDDTQEGPTPGTIYRWDPTFDTNSEASVLETNNLSGDILFVPSFALSGSGTNSQLWFADFLEPIIIPNGSKGVQRFNLTNGLCASNDTGTAVVGVAAGITGTNLDQSPVDVAIDSNQNIFVIQSIDDSPDSSPPVLKFPPYNPATNGGVAEMTPLWFAGNNAPSYEYASGIAVDSTSTHLAVAFGGDTNGSLGIFSAASGSLIATLDVGQNDPVTHKNTDCAWDAAGNVYTTRTYDDNTTPCVWRVYSPPGTNQALTVAPETLQVAAAPVQSPQITKIAESSGIVTITFTAGSNEPPSAFLVLGTAVITVPYSIISAATVSRVSSGVFQATFPASLAQQFYRIEIAAKVPPRISTLTMTNSTININFSASQADYPWYFTLQSAGAANGAFTNVPSASATQVSPGEFKFTTPLSAPSGFYRIRR